MIYLYVVILAISNIALRMYVYTDQESSKCLYMHKYVYYIVLSYIHREDVN